MNHKIAVRLRRVTNNTWNKAFSKINSACPFEARQILWLNTVEQLRRELIDRVWNTP